MALSETFPTTKSTTNIPRNMPAKRARPAKVPISAVELVEWTYAVQRAQGAPDIENYLGRNGCQTGIVVDRLIAYAQLGCEVDISSNAANVWGETRCHEDALTVHHAVLQLPWRQQELLIEHGRTRRAPDWQPKTFPLQCVPVMGNGGRPKGLYLGSGNRLVGCEVSYEGDWPSRDFAEEAKIAGEAHKRLWSEPKNWPAARVARLRRRETPSVVQHNWSDEPFRRCADEVILRAREIYQQWYEALWALCDGLEAAGLHSLSRYRIASLGAAYEPWRI